MSKNNTRRLVATLLALLVVCSFAGAPAMAAAGTSESLSSDDGVNGLGSDDGDSADDGDSSDDSTGEEDGEGSTNSTDEQADDSSSDSTDDGTSDSSDDSADEEDDDEPTENATDAINETVDETAGTVDETAGTVDETADDATYRTLEIIEATTEGEPDDALGVSIEGTADTEYDGDTQERLSPRELRSSPDAGADGDAYSEDDEAAVAAVDAVSGGGAVLSTGAGGQPVPTGTTGGAALGVGALAAVAVARSTPLVAASSSAGTTATSYLASLLDKVKPFVFPLRYSRYDDSDPLEHDAREEVYEIVNETPGSYLSEVSERAGLPLSTTRHHMKVLEREDLVSGAKLRGKRRFYPAYAEGIELAAALNDDSTASIIDALARLGAASVSDLADELGRDPSTISHHLQRLEEDSIIAREREGRAVMNKLSAEARTALEPETTPRPGEASEAVAGGAD